MLTLYNLRYDFIISKNPTNWTIIKALEDNFIKKYPVKRVCFLRILHFIFYPSHQEIDYLFLLAF